MNEKDYGGAAKYGGKGKAGSSVKGSLDSHSKVKEKKVKKEAELSEDEYYEEFDVDKILEAGRIASEVRKYIIEIVKKDVPLLEIAEKIEAKIEDLGGKPAFPVNTSVDDVAAHYTPAPNDESLARGLLKVDFGVSVDGWISDTAISFDLENDDENKKLIEAAQKALDSAIKVAKEGVRLSEIGKEIQTAIESSGFAPVINLSGHSISRYEVHSGATIPNYNNNGEEILEEGLIAIEPFATAGNGRVYDGKPSGIYQLINDRNVRSPIARKVLDYVAEEFSTLPFCSRWIVKKFGSMGLLGLRQLEANGNLHHFEQLIEVSHKKVAQAEHTLLIEKKGVTVTTK